MIPDAIPVALMSAAVFGALALMSDRRRGASIAQGVLVLGAVAMFVAIAADDTVAGQPRERVAVWGTALMAAAVSGMLYHLYLGRFVQVWTARGVFTLVFLVVSALFGLVFLSLI